MAASTATEIPARTEMPAWLRWAAVVWLAVYVPAYWRTWGPANFLLLCDIAVFLTCIGLWTRNRLLLSSQAVSTLFVGLAWALDVGWRIVAKHHLIGGTEYLFDPKVALWVRLLSLSHIFLPVLLLWVLWRMGYDRRAWILQSAIALAAFVACRFTNPAKNMNFAFRDPFFHCAWGPAPAHIAVITAFMMVVVYLPTHLALARIFRTYDGSGAPA
jgi:hypothetical protein